MSSLFLSKYAYLTLMTYFYNRWRKALSLIIILFSAATLNGSQALNDLRSLTQQWVALEQSITKEAIAWEEKAFQLNDLIKITQLEVEYLEEELKILEAAATTADDRREELLIEKEQLKKDTLAIQKFLPQIEHALRHLKTRLPQPLQETLDPLYQRLPKDPNSTSLNIADRMQTVIGILSATQKFNDVITINQEIKTLTDGTQGEVTTLYIGLGAGFYITTAGNDAGYGYPTETGWVWESQASLMKPISKAIAIAENVSQEAKFISLPVNSSN